MPSQTSPTAHSLIAAPSIAPAIASPRDEVARSKRLNNTTPGELIPPSPKTPSRAVPSRATQPSGRAAPRNKKFSEKVRWNTANKMRRKIGIPQILCVNTLSALSERERFSSFAFLFFTRAVE